MRHFLTKLIAIETLEEFYQSCLVTRKVYYIDPNSLLAMVLFLTAGQFGYGLNNLNSSHRNTRRSLLPVFRSTGVFYSFDLEEISKWLQMHFNISTLNEQSFCV